LETPPFDLAICSIFRDNESHGNLSRYLQQISSLTIPLNKIFFSWIEGDSKDKTYQSLFKFAKDKTNISLIKKDTKTPYYGSQAVQGRFDALTPLANLCLENAKSKSKYMVWLESDLIVSNPNVFKTLIEHLENNEKIGLIAPVIFFDPNDPKLSVDYPTNKAKKVFYDQFVFRDINTDRRWDIHPPYSPNYKPNSLIEMNSAGSCVLFRSELIDKGCRLKKENVLIGFCESIRKLGYSIYVDARSEVYHPRGKKIDGRWIG
jgi:GT2 family glycosyltransferase